MSKSPSDPLSLFQQSRRPHKKKPYVYKKERKEQLIKLPPAVAKVEPKNFDALDKLLLTDTTYTEKSLSTLPREILAGNLDTDKKDRVRAKYADQEFPLPRSRSVLREKAQRYLPLIPRFLAGDEELSVFYSLAHLQRKTLAHATMTLKERWDIQWERYVGGFYGLTRQLYVSALIQAAHGQLLAKSTNKTIMYWTPDMFSTYVLANEVLLRVLMDDMGLLHGDAEKMMKDTQDYGCYVADDVEFVDDVEVEAML